MNEQMIEHLIYKIGALEKESRNLEARLSKVEQQIEVMGKKYRRAQSPQVPPESTNS